MKKYLSLFIAVAIIIVGFYLYQSLYSNDVELQVEQTEAEEQTTGFTEFKSEKFGFSFMYPEDWEFVDGEFWLPGAYELHLNPPEQCDVCHIPRLKFEAFPSESSAVLDFMGDTYDLPEGSLEELAEGIMAMEFEIVKIHGEEITRFVVKDMQTAINYIVEKPDVTLVFTVYGEEQDDETLKDILSSVVFE